MAFGNPYDEPWGPEIVEDTLVWLKDIGVRTVSLADTVGLTPANHVGALYSAVKDCVAGIELGVHLHSRPEDAAEKVLAAYDAGCRRFDGALTGLGGCPFARDDLVGNIATEEIVSALAARGANTGIRVESLPSGDRLDSSDSSELRSSGECKLECARLSRHASWEPLTPMPLETLKLETTA